ncbi:glycosyltransferase family 2 protein [Deinococcus marmoris]|uniref:glycosyltransferase family 2 protein n=1 Tax=Deinococcus marmoris TaxID=249408 RepID=UPI00068C3DCD|nr:glycosyltransferase family 2 protein [Deinococcus marmoris]
MTELHSPTVTVVVINYNQTDLTLACLASLSALHTPLARVVVVDNGSFDDSVARLQGHVPAADLLVLPVNVGFTAANNAGCRFALQTGEPAYVWFLNNDTLVDPGALDALVNILRARPQVGAAASVLYDMGTDRVQAYGGGWIDLWAGRAQMFTAPVPEERFDFVAGTSLLVRVTAIAQVGLLDERFFMYWEDADFSFRLRRAGWTLTVAPESTVWHLGGASTGVNTVKRKSVTFERYFSQSTVVFYRKHSRIPAVPLLRGLGWYFVKRLIKREWPQARAIVQGTLHALRVTAAHRATLVGPAAPSSTAVTSGHAPN